LPEGVLPEDVLPEGVLPEGVLPEGVLPEDVLPEGVLPEGVWIVGRICRSGQSSKRLVSPSTDSTSLIGGLDGSDG
jgi:hypothetical protein